MDINDVVPDEILFIIFQYFFSITQANITAMFVCKRWYNVLEELLKLYHSHTAHAPLSSTDKYILGHLRVKTFNLISHGRNEIENSSGSELELLASPSVEELNCFALSGGKSGIFHETTTKNSFPKLKKLKLYGVNITSDLLHDPNHFFSQIPSIEAYWLRPHDLQKFLLEKYPHFKVFTKLKCVDFYLNFRNPSHSESWNIDTVVSDFKIILESQSVMNPAQLPQFIQCLMDKQLRAERRVLLETVLDSARDIDRDLLAISSVTIAIAKGGEEDLDYFIGKLPERFGALLYHEVIKGNRIFLGQWQTTVECLIKHKFPVDRPDKDGNIPLHFAIKSGGRRVTKMLIDAGEPAHLLVKNKEGLCPYHHFVAHISKIRKQEGRRRNTQFSRFYIPGIHFFLHYYPAEISCGFIHLMLSSGGDEEVLETMYNVYPGCLTYANDNGVPALHAMSSDHQIRCLQIFMREPTVDLNATDTTGRTALMLYLEKGLYGLAFELIECDRVDVTVKDNKGRSALHLLAAASTRMRGSNSVMSQDTKANWIEFLVKKGLKINEKDSTGHTPFHYAATLCEKNVLKEMIDLGAEINDPFPDQIPLLTHVVKASVPESALGNSFGILVQNGASLETVDDEGNTIMHIACTENNGDVVSAILKDKYGANLVNTRNKKGLSPIQICFEQTADQLSQNLKVFIKCKQTDYTALTLSCWGRILAMSVADSDTAMAVVILDRLSDLKVSSFPSENTKLSLNPSYPEWMQPAKFEEIDEEISILHAACLFGYPRVTECIFKNKLFQEFIAQKMTQGTSFAAKLSLYLQLPELQLQSDAYKGAGPMHAIFLNPDLKASDQTKLIKLMTKYADGKSINWEQEVNGKSIIDLAQENSQITKELVKYCKNVTSNQPTKRKAGSAVTDPEEDLPRKRKRYNIDYSVFDRD